MENSTSITQLELTHKELIQMILERQGITEGEWALLVRFTLAAINAGPSSDEIMPSAIAGVSAIGIQRAEPGFPGIKVDASTLSAKREQSSEKQKPATPPKRKPKTS